MEPTTLLATLRRAGITSEAFVKYIAPWAVADPVRQQNIQRCVGVGKMPFKLLIFLGGESVGGGTLGHVWGTGHSCFA